MRVARGAFIACVVFLFGFAGVVLLQAQQTTTAAPTLRMGRYDKSTETTFNGTVVAVQGPSNSKLPRGTYLVVRSGAITWNVHMGLFASKAIPFASGDSVQITGSVISFNGQQILLARQVNSGSKSITVRSTGGFVLRPHPAAQTQG